MFKKASELLNQVVWPEYVYVNLSSCNKGANSVIEQCRTAV